MKENVENCSIRTMVRRATLLRPVRARNMTQSERPVLVVIENIMNVQKLDTARETGRGEGIEEVMLREKPFTLERETLPQKMVRPY